jgi:hypothetical protein
MTKPDGYIDCCWQQELKNDCAVQIFPTDNNDFEGPLDPVCIVSPELLDWVNRAYQFLTNECDDWPMVSTPRDLIKQLDAIRGKK